MQKTKACGLTYYSKAAGYFAHFPVDNDASYRLAIENIIGALRALEKQHEE